MQPKKPTRGTKVERSCETCGKATQVREADVKRGWGRFCSKSCKAKHKSSERKETPVHKELLTLSKARINIIAFGEYDELQIALRGMGSIFTWPQFCTLYPPGEVIKHHRLHVESPDSKVVFNMDINDPAEGELLTGLLDKLKEKAA